MLAAQLLHQTVVSAAAADGALCADAVGDELKNRLGVIVQTAHDRGVNGEGNTGAVEIFFHFGEVALAVLAEIVGDFRRVLGNLLVLRAFAVEQTHGVLLQTRKAGFAKLLTVTAEIVAQRLIVIRAALGASDGIELQTDLAQSEAVDDRLRGADQLRVRDGRLGAVLLQTELVELSESACLRLLIAVAGHKVARLDRQTFVLEVVLQHRSCGSRGSLGTERHALAALGVEGVHLLLHHVGRLSHAAREQLGVLKDGRADLPEPVSAAFLAHDIFDKLPAEALLGQNVLRTLDFLCDQRHFHTSRGNALRLRLHNLYRGIFAPQN